MNKKCKFVIKNIYGGSYYTIVRWFYKKFTSVQQEVSPNVKMFGQSGTKDKQPAPCKDWRDFSGERIAPIHRATEIS